MSDSCEKLNELSISIHIIFITGKSALEYLHIPMFLGLVYLLSFLGFCFCNFEENKINIWTNL